MFRSFQYLASLICTAVLVVFAAVPAHAQAAGAPNPIMNFIPIVFMFGVAYFLIMRPQMKKQKDHQAFLAKIERGDEVITSSGILGRVEGLTDSHVTLEIAPNVRVKMLRSAVAGSAKIIQTAPEVKA